ncbi:VTT domain-containing protein [Caldibacillus lycopersici]|uniref:TVP38/TMEM64 family membrane protein n=1 Tax=Perspicuibacillus lycopersici TaxID=1325689 RepID=A0AAE3IU16_9BACI|nr:VTT domain-containing protein [Perspicuibacillus lycopersici]MCU9614162.1 VTT domain-containing protein [Perspicuibacillus lycopersici]
MDDKASFVISFLEVSGIFAPIAFIAFHTFRQFLFVPVVVVCLAGGLLFGTVFGSIFSLVGLTFSSLMFYFILKMFPRVHKKLFEIKRKWFGPYSNFTSGQVAVLKLIPFMHYQLLCFCLMERQKSFSEYAFASFMTNIPVVIFYTVFGQFFKQFSPSMAIIVLIALSVLIVVLREKVVVIKWKDFFKATI